MKKIILIIPLLIALYFSLRSSNKPQTVSLDILPPVSQTIELPPSWERVEDPSSLYKFEKKVDQGLKPQIIFAKSESKNAPNQDVYLNHLIAGARSAIPSLRVISDERQSFNDYYFSAISAYYYSRNTKINLLQRVYLKGETVYTLTASYVQDLSSEINQIFDTLVAKEL